MRFRGQNYTIESFEPDKGRFGTSVIKFVEPVHTPEVPDEISVDLVQS